MASEPALHSCPSCPAVTDRDDVCINCDRAPAVDGFCVTCDPGPLLAEIADSRVSPEVVRLAVEAAVAAEREECAVALEQSAAKLSSAGVTDLAEAFGTMAQALRARGRVSIG